MKPRMGSLADLLEGMDDGPNEMPRPHISIRPIGGPMGMGGPFGFPGLFGGMGRPTGPVHVSHVSLGDFFKNIAKPGPHPSFLDEKKEDDKKPDTNAKAPGIKIVDITPTSKTPDFPAAPAVAETKKPEIAAVPEPATQAQAVETAATLIKLVNPIKAAAEIKK